MVFSEIYYPKGWDVYVDGNKAPCFRADYLLRAMVVPSGKHIIEFTFKPKAWSIGEPVSLISSIILLLVLGWFVFSLLKRAVNKNKK